MRYTTRKKGISTRACSIDRITVYRSKGKKSEEVTSKYEYMTNICKRAISQCEDIVFSDVEFKVPKELYE